MSLESTSTESTFSPLRRFIEYVLTEEIIKSINNSNLPNLKKEFINSNRIYDLLDYEHKYARYHRQKRESEYKNQKGFA